MPKYYFHLAGQLPAHDLLGHDCYDNEMRSVGVSLLIESELKARHDSRRQFISVTDEVGKEIFQISLASVTV
jgi:hypothetical protein